jgi:GMP reductase
MRIEEDIKLDFRDVLIRPKRSTLSSRRDVDLKRFYRFKHSRYEYDGIPIMAANMDGVGTLSMAKALAQHGLFTCLIKTYNTDIENYGDFRLHHDHYAISTE